MQVSFPAVGAVGQSNRQASLTCLTFNLCVAMRVRLDSTSTGGTTCHVNGPRFRARRPGRLCECYPSRLGSGLALVLLGYALQAAPAGAAARYSPTYTTDMLLNQSDNRYRSVMMQWKPYEIGPMYASALASHATITLKVPHTTYPLDNQVLSECMQFHACIQAHFISLACK